MESVLWAFGIVVVIANTLVSLRLFQSSSYDTTQKLGQTVVIWLVPVIGVSLIWYFLKEPVSQPRRNTLADHNGHRGR